MSPAVRVAVILLNYRNAHDTVECLESLRYSTYPTFGVVVVDCASGDDSLERISSWADGASAGYATAAWEGLRGAEPRHRPHGVLAIAPRRIREISVLPSFDDRLAVVPATTNRGFAAGCNLALRAALRDPGVEFCWLLNNDTIVGAGTLEKLVARAAADPRPGAVGCVIASYAQPDRVECLAGGRVHRFSAEPIFCGFGTSREALPGEPPALDYVSGTCCFVPRSTIETVGLLDESMFLYWEDTDWSARMRRHGLSLACALDAIVWHKGHSSTGGINAFTKFHHFRSATVYMRRYRRWWLFPVLYRLTKNLLRDLARGNLGDMASATRGFVAGLRLGTRRRAAGMRPC